MSKSSDWPSTQLLQLSPPEQLVAFGIVAQISEIQIKLQITGGTLVLVDRSNICHAYTNLLKSPTAAPKLSQLFKKGQQYVCKVIERRPRKGYAQAQDYIATLNPTELMQDILPATLFSIPQVPMQCAIESVEDHGYRVDVGFKGLTGFLHFDEAEEYCNKYQDGQKFRVGQIIRCCTLSKTIISSDLRVIQLSMRKEILTKSIFSRDKCMNHSLNARCILPGSTGFLTVMKVSKFGLDVNFMDEFSGFVGVHHLKDDWDNPKNYKISTTSKCTVLSYNPTTNTFVLSLKSKPNYKKSLKQFLTEFHVGQVIKKAEVAYINGLKAVHFKVNGFKALANVKDVLQDDIGTMGKDEIYNALDAAYPEGTKHRCRIKSINYADLVLVLSLRQEFLDLPFVSVEELKPGDFLEATVKKYVSDGIIVTFGLNLRAIILNSHLNDYVSAKSYKKYPIGKPIKCRVLKVDFEKHPPRVYLTNKEQLMDPEMTTIDSYDRSFKGETVNAIVSKLKQDGIIVELFNNVKGFIPRRFCSTTPIRSVGNLFEVGQVTSCTVYRVEAHRQSLLLGIIPYDRIKEMKREKKRLLLQKKEQNKLRQIENKIGKNVKKVQLGEKRKRTVKEKSSNDDENIESNSDQIGEEHNEVGSKELEERKRKKSRLERSIEAREREERIRETERALMDTKRPAQSIQDFERLVLASPNSGDVWIKYSKFFLDNVETEKARIVCRRALRTINFRMEKEKLKIWLQLIKIEAKFGGTDKLEEMIEEAALTNDKLELFRKAAKVLITCGEFDEAEKLYNSNLKLGPKVPEVWIEYISFLMEHRKDLAKARGLFERACKSLVNQADKIYARSRFAYLEFKLGDVERGKTMFENLLSENPRRMDLRKVYVDAIKKFIPNEQQIQVE